jgi:hypothetical protein
MSFSKSGSTITQTGTDADLSGLANIAGITVTPMNHFTLYYSASLKFVVNGNLTIDPEKEMLIMGSGVGSTEFTVNNGATWQVGTESTLNNHTRVSAGFAFISMRDAYDQAVNINSGATFKLYGAGIQIGSFFRMNAGCILDIKQGLMHERGINSVSVNRELRFDTNLGSVNGLTVNGFNFVTFLAVPAIFKGFAPVHVRRAAIGTSGATADQTWMNFEDYSGQGNSADSIIYSDTFIRLKNSVKGTDLKIRGEGPHTRNSGIVEMTKEFQLNVVDDNGPAQGVKLYLKDTDNGNRVNFNSSNSYTADREYTGASDSAGLISAIEVVTGVGIRGGSSGRSASGVGSFNSGVNIIDLRSKTNTLGVDDYTLFLASYQHDLKEVSVTLKGAGVLTVNEKMFDDFSRTEQNPSVVNVYPVSVSVSGNTITVAGDNSTVQNLTSAQLYDVLKVYFVNNLGIFTNLLATRSGNEINAAGYNVNLSYISFIGDMITDQIISLSNGSVFNGTRTDANGTILAPRSVSITGLVAGSRLRVYNTTTSTQVVNQVVAGTSYTATYAEGVGYSAGNVLEYRVTRIDKLEFIASVIVTSAGWSALVSQDNNPTYAAHGKDGSTVTGISWDSGNMQFDFNETDNVIDGPDIGAWYQYFITTPTGIAEALGALRWPQVNRITNVTSKAAITWDNTKSTPLQINNLWADRDDGVSIIAAGSNSIQINPPAVFVQETGVSGLTSAESAKLDVISDVNNNTKIIPALL